VKRNGQLIKTYHYEDSTTTFMEIFMIFVMPFKWIITANTHTIENLVVTFLYDLEQDKVLEGAGPAPPGAPPPPLAPPPPGPGTPDSPGPSPPPVAQPARPATCAYCGQALPAGARECPGCGSPVKH